MSVPFCFVRAILAGVAVSRRSALPSASAAAFSNAAHVTYRKYSTTVPETMTL
jgi:hypothetical protein